MCDYHCLNKCLKIISKDTPNDRNVLCKLFQNLFLKSSAAIKLQYFPPKNNTFAQWNYSFPLSVFTLQFSRIFRNKNIVIRAHELHFLVIIEFISYHSCICFFFRIWACFCDKIKQECFFSYIKCSLTLMAFPD